MHIGKIRGSTDLQMSVGQPQQPRSERSTERYFSATEVVVTFWEAMWQTRLEVLRLLTEDGSVANLDCGGFLSLENHGEKSIGTDDVPFRGRGRNDPISQDLMLMHSTN